MPEKRFFSIQWKLIIANVFLPLLAMIVATAFTIHAINSFIFHQAQNKIINDLSSAHEIYYSNLRCLNKVISKGAASYPLVQAFLDRDQAALKREIQSLRRREGLSLLSLTDSNGKVLMRANNPVLKGDFPSLQILSKALIGSPSTSTEVLPLKEIIKENKDLKHLVEIKVIATPKARKREIKKITSGMFIMAACPIHDPQGNIIGSLYGGKLLNHNNFLVDKIKKVIFSDEAFSGQDIGTATIFQDDVRIATNVLDSSGHRAIGTRVSKEVYERVIVDQQKWTDRAFVVNNWYISAYEPIYNSMNEAIGILYVGMLEKPFIDFRSHVMVVLVIILALGCLLTFLVVFFCARNFSRRIMGMEDGLQQVAEGRLETVVPVTGNDEIGQLENYLNQMIRALRDRDASIDQLHKELENKVAQRTSEIEKRNQELTEMKHHLLEMMEDKKSINVRLEESLTHLQQAQQQLIRSGKLAALGSLVAGVAHEINNPINIISGNLELLEMDPETRKRFSTEIEIITYQADRIKKIIGNMLGFSRFRQTPLQELDINDLIEKVITPLRPQLENLKIKVIINPGTPAHVMSDEDSLMQILNNLIVNSLQAMPNGGQLEISTVVTQDSREIIISDTGCGMTSEQVENMFNPFYSTKADGTGLGLSISYELIRTLGGDIDVNSVMNVGTIITITLPGTPQKDK